MTSDVRWGGPNPPTCYGCGYQPTTLADSPKECVENVFDMLTMPLAGVTEEFEARTAPTSLVFLSLMMYPHAARPFSYVILRRIILTIFF